MSFNLSNYESFRHSLIELIDSIVPNYFLEEVNWEFLKAEYMMRKFVNSRNEYFITKELFKSFLNPHMEFVKKEKDINFYPVLLFVGDEGVFISRADELNRNNYIIKNKLIGINGQSIEKIKKRVENEYSRFSIGIKDKQLIKALREVMDENNYIECIISSNNGNKSFRLDSIGISEQKKEKLGITQKTDVTLKNYENYIYFKPFSFQMEKCSDFYYAKLCTNKKNVLVLDLRYNGGGLINEAKKFVGFFLEDEIKIGYKLTKKNYSDVSKPVVIYPEIEKLKFSTIYILTNRYTMSSSEFIVIEGLRKSYKDVIIVGEETGGLYSEAERYKCTDGSNFQVLSAAMIDCAGKPIYKGIAPDIPIVLDFINPASVKELKKYLAAIKGRMSENGIKDRLFKV